MPVRVSESSVDEAFSELWSGDRIQSAGGIRCTIGSTGYYNGSSAIVTCGHGLSLNQTLYYNDSRIGEVRFHRFLDDAYGDYSIVPLSNTEHSIVNKSFGPSESSSNPIRVTGYSAEPPRGVSVFAYGQHNGWSIAKVIDSDVTVNVSVLGQVTTIKGLTVLKTSSGRVGHGDSGGPVYIYNGNGYSVCGIISSRSVSH